MLEIEMTARIQTPSGKSATGPELARARTMRLVAIALAIAAFGTLAYGFGMNWAAPYQVAAGVAAYVGIEWQRHIGKKIKQMGG
jgi:hypothetical protein